MMIEVNLLPQELRKVEHTPLPRFLIIIIGTTLISITISLGAFVYMRKLPDLARLDAALDQEAKAAVQSEREHDLLVGQIDEVKQRKRAIAEIWRARIIWSEKLTQLSEMVPKIVGLEKITLEEAKRAGGAENGGYLYLASVCAGADAERVAMYRRTLSGDYPAEGSPDPLIGRVWFQDFASIEPTPWVRKEVPDYQEKEALSFTLKLAIKPDSLRLKEYLDAHKETAPVRSRAARSTRPAPATTQPAPTPVSNVQPVGTPQGGESDARRAAQ